VSETEPSYEHLGWKMTKEKTKKTNQGMKSVPLRRKRRIKSPNQRGGQSENAARRAYTIAGSTLLNLAE